MEQIVRDIAGLVGSNTLVFDSPIKINGSDGHYITKVSKDKFTVAETKNGIIDLTNQKEYMLSGFDPYHLEVILGILQVQHELTE